MGFLARIKSQFPDYDDRWYPSYGYGYDRVSATGVAVGPETAIRCNAVLACVKLISETFAAFPLKMFRRRRDGGKDVRPQHPLYGLLHSRPNRWNTSYEWRETSMAHLLLWGRCHSEIVPGPRGSVDQLIPLTPGRVRVITENKQRKYIYRPPGINTPDRTLLEDEVFTVNGLSFDSVVGLEPMALARESVGLSLAEEEYHARMFSGGAQLSGILSHPKTLSDKARTNLETTLNDKHTGLKKSWRWMVTEEDMKVTVMSMRGRDAEALESRRFQIAEVCRPFRVPPHMIGDVSGSTSWGTGIEAQTIGFVVYTMLSWLVRWEQAISRDLIQEPDLYFAEFLIDGLLRGDTAARGEFYTKMFNIGVFSLNEIREKENMNRIEGGDGHYVQLNMARIDQLGAIQQPAGESQEPPEKAQLTERTEATRLAQMIHFAAEKLANKESVAVRKAIARFQGAAEFAEWADEFYLGLAVDISENLQVPFDVAERFAQSAKRELIGAHDVGAHDVNIHAIESRRAMDLSELSLGNAEEVSHVA